MVRIKQEQPITCKIEIQENLDAEYEVHSLKFESDTINNHVSITIFLDKVSDSPSPFNYVFWQAFEGLTITASIDVFMGTIDNHGDYVQTHQEMGINIEKPFANKETSFS